MKKSRSMDSLDKLDRRLAISHVVVVSQPVSIPMNWPAHNKGREQDPLKPAPADPPKPSPTDVPKASPPPAPPSSAKPRVLSPPPPPETRREKVSPSSGAIPVPGPGPVSVPSADIDQSALFPASPPRKPLPPKPLMRFTGQQPNRASFLCETQIEPTRPPPLPPKPKNLVPMKVTGD